MPAFEVPTIARRLARRDYPRTEADIQAVVRALLLPCDFGLESPAGQRHRIDVEARHAITWEGEDDS